MPTQTAASRPPGSALAIALGATAGLWALLYLVMMPPLATPPWLAVGIVLIVLLAAGLAAGRWAAASMLDGARIGAAIALINLLILGSLLGGDRPGEVVVDGLIWVGGLLVAAVVLGAVGARLTRPASHGSVDWTAWIGMIAAATTFMLLVAGGIVTGLEAGLAVPGWLTAFDYPLVLFPLRLMQDDGGVYAEHAHRLWGLLVGLTMILLVIHLWMNERRRWVVHLAAALLLAVIVQGTLGGTRVTEASTTLAIAHGVFGQVVFAGMVTLAVVSFTAFRSSSAAFAASDRKASLALIGVLLAQLTLGAIYRHLNADPDAATAFVHLALGAHLILAAVVVTLAVLVGGRIASRYREVATTHRLSLALLVLIGLQVIFGIAALTVVLLRRDDATTIPVYEVVLTTMHQATGALILGCAAGLAAWVVARPSDAARPAASPQPIS